jgi:hypothetical protein
MLVDSSFSAPAPRRMISTPSHLFPRHVPVKSSTTQTQSISNQSSQPLDPLVCATHRPNTLHLVQSVKTRILFLSENNCERYAERQK